MRITANGVVFAAFDGGEITSDAGVLLLRGRDIVNLTDCKLFRHFSMWLGH